jgi:DNA invertase Pin-like site-specific DNA recombinase
MASSLRQLAQTDAPKRAAVYLRVSTGRQAENDVSLPSQRDLTKRFCEGQGWSVVEEYVESGASATDDRRPVFQRMLEDARSPDRRFDVICVYAFSRFYRNGAEMEMTIRRLRKCGVEVVSVTQPTGDDPSQEMMRQMIGLFDEYTSRENGKNVSRAMRESAKQGFWNGATPPLGYKIVEAETRGSKIKKKLAVEPVDAETVRLMFRLYAEGDGATGPLGVKDVAKWLNGQGYRTRKGATFGIGPVHGILTNRCYATGKWPYGVRNSKTGQLNDPATVVEIDVPTIIPMDLFEQVQAKLARNNPKVTPPRTVNGPNLLAGLATCATCGAGMVRTGTACGKRSYTYYSCAGCHQKGKSVCKGRHIPTAKLDNLIMENVKEKLLMPERLSFILEALLERSAAKDVAVAERRRSLDAQVAQAKDKLARLYRAIEEGVVDLDDDLKSRIVALKDERDIAVASLKRIAQQASARSDVTPDLIEAFAELMRQKLDDGDVQARRGYLRTVISNIEVDDDRIRLTGDKASLAEVIAGKAAGAANVSSLVRKWRAISG